MRVQLVCENVGFDDVEFELSENSLVLGRSLRADVQVVHPLISRLHCEWKLINGELVVRDLESTNQTLINGEPVQQTVLRSGDRILLGDVLYIVDIAERQPRGSEASPGHLDEAEGDSDSPTTRLAVKTLWSRSNQE